MRLPATRFASSGILQTHFAHPSGVPCQPGQPDTTEPKGRAVNCLMLDLWPNRDKRRVYARPEVAVGRHLQREAKAQPSLATGESHWGVVEGGAASTPKAPSLSVYHSGPAPVENRAQEVGLWFHFRSETDSLDSVSFGTHTVLEKGVECRLWMSWTFDAGVEKVGRPYGDWTRMQNSKLFHRNTRQSRRFPTPLNILSPVSVSFLRKMESD
jgi:hypothetical protein